MNRISAVLNFDKPGMNECGVLRCANPSGAAESLGLRATFEYRNALYAVVESSGSKGCFCCRLKWNFFKGLYRTAYSVSRTVGFAAKELAVTESESALAAPHYRVTAGEDGSLTYTEAPCPGITDKKHEYIPHIVRAVLVFLLTVIAFLRFNSLFADLLLSVIGIGSPAAVKCILFGVMLAISYIVYALDDSKSGIFSVLIAVLMGVNVGVSFLFPVIMPTSLISLGGIAALLFLLRILPCLYFLKDRQRKKNRAAIRKKLIKRLRSSVIVLVLFYSILFIILLDADVLEPPSVSPYNGSAVEIKVDPGVLSDYDEALELIRDEVWEELTSEQRLEVLEHICAYECEATLGCPMPKIETEELSFVGKYRTLGMYDPSDDTIKIDSGHIATDSSASVLNTLLHELRHCYQFALINMYNNVEKSLSEEDRQLSIFRYVQSLRFNLNNYITSDKSFDDYVSQEAERDSNSWAKQRLEGAYYRHIYIDNTSPDAEGK